eukprot:m.117148 g.117148  ORF g.117148 m.117148 type:complete len:57 (+) comp9318_c2_seq2:5623-5793(+)
MCVCVCCLVIGSDRCESSCFAFPWMASMGLIINKEMLENLICTQYIKLKSWCATSK